MTEASEYKSNQPITSGLVEDINKLLGKVVDLFDEHSTLRFCHFVTVWKDMKFPLIFHGRATFRELYEFTEDLFEIVKGFTVSPHKVGVRAGGLYLLYSLYFRQKTRPMVRIRLNLDEFRDLNDWVDRCRKDRHWELVYVWQKLRTEQAFYFVACTKPVGIESIGAAEKRAGIAGHYRMTGAAGHRLYTEPLKSENFRMVIEAVKKIDGRYRSMKAALSSGETDLGLSLISEDLTDKLTKLADHKGSAALDHLSKPGGNLLEENGTTIGQRRKKLREQAFGGNQSPVKKKSDIKDESPKKVRKARGRPKGAKNKASPTKLVIPEFEKAAKSLAVVKQDPALLEGIVKMPSQKGRRGPGRPPLSPSKRKKKQRKIKAKPTQPESMIVEEDPLNDVMEVVNEFSSN